MAKTHAATERADPADRAERRKVADLIPYARNSRTHSEAQVAKIAASIRAFGFTSPVLIKPDNTIIAGHGRVLAAAKLKRDDVPVIVADGWSENDVRTYVIADNRLALDAGWDEDILALELAQIQDDGGDVSLTGFEADELEKLLAAEAAAIDDEAADAVPATPSKAVTTRGDVWILGRHRVICGDATDEKIVERVLGGRDVDCILTDPPYCSGGFQEAGKSSGSIGTRSDDKIANDRLSTRGYIAPMQSVLGAVRCPILYAFTDWRMWIHLFDVAESKGYGARSMIVWNKGHPGMGRGWRAQHELILCGGQDAIPFSPQKSQGNVITCKRQANELHPTQKPVELLETIIDTTDFANVFYDPFGGSGTTLIACERKGKAARLCEMSPAFVDVIVTRWQTATGGEAKLESTGECFADVKAKRRG